MRLQHAPLVADRYGNGSINADTAFENAESKPL